jgi:hypothetical protein
LIWLGVTAKVGYEAGNFRTGLEGIFFVVEKPDGVQLGPFPMDESSLFGAGRYHGYWTATPDDPEGRYFFYITSPQENGRKATTAVEMTRRPIPEINVLADQKIETEVNVIEGSQITIALEDTSVSVAAVQVGPVVAIEAQTDEEVDLDVNEKPAKVSVVVDQFTVDIES